MTDQRPPTSDGASVPGTLTTLAICMFLGGFALGLMQPLFGVGVGATVVAGPTYVGLLFLLCVLLALVMGGLAFFGAGRLAVPAFVGCGALALGLLAGNWVAASLHISFAANRSAAARPTFAPSSPVPDRVVREAPATVVVRLDGVPDFAPNAGGNRFTSVDAAGNVVDGVFGQWCVSGPDTEEVASIETLDVGRLGDTTVVVNVNLTTPTFPRLPGMSMALPRVQIRLNPPDRSEPYIWTGQGQVKAVHGMSGRLAFTDLVSDRVGAVPATFTGELTWTCSNWLASEP
jgi:hypothetical protein